MNLHLYFHSGETPDQYARRFAQALEKLQNIEFRLDSQDELLRSIGGKVDQNAMTLTELQAQVTKNTEVEESAVTLIKGLATQIASLKNDPVAIQALADSLTKSAGDLGDAITANTPAA